MSPLGKYILSQVEEHKGQLELEVYPASSEIPIKIYAMRIGIKVVKL